MGLAILRAEDDDVSFGSRPLALGPEAATGLLKPDLRPTRRIS